VGWVEARGKRVRSAGAGRLLLSRPPDLRRCSLYACPLTEASRWRGPDGGDVGLGAMQHRSTNDGSRSSQECSPKGTLPPSPSEPRSTAGRQHRAAGSARPGLLSKACAAPPFRPFRARVRSPAVATRPNGERSTGPTAVGRRPGVPRRGR